MTPTINDCGFTYILTNKSFAVDDRFGCAPIKIGVTTDIESRLGVLNSSTPEKFNVHTLFPTCFYNRKKKRSVVCSIMVEKLEKCLHARFAHRRANNGEFFYIDPDVALRYLKSYYNYLSYEKYQNLLPLENIEKIYIKLANDTLYTIKTITETGLYDDEDDFSDNFFK
jgi:hypothetical protein